MPSQLLNVTEGSISFCEAPSVIENAESRDEAARSRLCRHATCTVDFECNPLLAYLLVTIAESEPPALVRRRDLQHYAEHCRCVRISTVGV